ncbi:hypothetical protein UFOVP1528_41 [uncultured Caudovirales phage]|uniref:Major capsid protein n=1 Tax=uncultured Caudovirales phage TaxID=2100421 RepID=A0A6J5RJP5_9CAUD|nr:hypothetical protein UFOVP905_34 [uncultured Caudovirales phage]CAB4182793.1 hypothetical protein UFOVP1080_22 [uncultured Caudovirales phage]CAB4197239.1 hypothetical protein UFOVP1321_10 [uncultured Caudovirales phage]CAB4212304.1 hypothetical protein UFOVP1432_5 [uncultured Caudovirales phage]CAB5227464.1 hypothetical protein UFOVP1528_41 [uncultured Caudovirales phage]
MAGHDYTKVNDNLVRSELWSDQLKDVLKDMLQGQQYVNWMTNFPDGTTFTIPSLGELPIRNVTEADPAVYDAMDTGEFNFTIDKYVESATFITDKAKQDAYYADQLIASFIPKMKRAMEENLESNIMTLAASQTLANANTINGASHRFVARGASNTTLSIEDFAAAKFAMDKAAATQRRIAIIDPSQEYVLNTLSGLVNVTNNPKFEGIVNEGFVNSATGLRFSKNIFGFDVYVSNYLATIASTEAINADSRGSVTSPSAAVQNMFLSIGADETPFKGAWRQMPRVEFERNKDLRRDEYVMNARYGLKLYRPECLVVCLSKTTI